MEVNLPIVDLDAVDLEDLTISNTTFLIELHPLREDILEEIKEGYSQDEQAREIYHHLSNQLDPPNTELRNLIIGMVF
ncbi:uncharacterized protein KGF55_000095 [Candida pseudojiufengensis]|uniref:uncharacterized protein n=1 Tax=Candida pseudojiufengensis TaxID=497109 RepID=UPI0022256199|nr:uncharacterized protein KGF55_000095 [Candida pseudojiufengensis]KAI5967607.1 hypothetical protein KGF55_000095 [Candida pseudojiufengensis]